MTYVPEIVKQEISQQVAADIEKKVSADVVARAQTEGWGVPAPCRTGCATRSWSGDLRLQGRSDLAKQRQRSRTRYLNFQAINEAGSIDKAGNNALLDTTDDQVKYSARLRFGVESKLSDVATVGFRLATGDRDNPVSANVALDDYNTGFDVRVDEAYLRLGETCEPDGHRLYFWGGRMRSPFEHTELVWDPDLRFNGFAAQYAWNTAPDHAACSQCRAYFPLQGVDVS